jgi:hypothetical protein
MATAPAENKVLLLTWGAWVSYYQNFSETVVSLSAQGKNNSTGLHRIWVRLQGTCAGAYQGICAGGWCAVEGRKDKQDGGIIFPLRPYTAGGYAE